MSSIHPNLSANSRYTARPAQAKQQQHLSPFWRTEKIVVSPLAAVGTGLKSGAKATFATTALVGTLGATSHPFLAAAVGLGGFIGVPLYAATRAIGRFFSNIKAGVTGHSR